MSVQLVAPEIKRKGEVGMKRRNRTIICAGLLVLLTGMLAGCAAKTEDTAELPPGYEAEFPAEGGTLVLKVNPEIAVEYDENGKVTAVRGRNEDGRKIVEGYQDYIGKECHEVVEDLVGVIHEAGYFVEEVEGESKKITIEIETGSVLPEEDFLDEIVTGVQAYVKNMQMDSPVVGGVGDGTTDFDIYDHEYGEEAYRAVVPLEEKSPSGPASDAQTSQASPETEKTADAASQPGGNGAAGEGTTANSGEKNPETGTRTDVNRPVNQELPYTDYETPYTEPESHTDYETPYTEPESHTDYETPYTEPEPTDYETPYTEPEPHTDYETPYTEADSPYTDFHEESSHESSDNGDSGYSHYD